MNYVIIEDEPAGRMFLQEIMLRYLDQMKLLGVASTVSEGIELIKRLKPDLVLLDAEIGEGTGFDILNAFEKINFHVIFITAHEHYALKAIKYSAIDYLLKPVILSELDNALKKIAIDNNNVGRIETLKENLNIPGFPGNIMINHSKGYTVVSVEDIAYLEAHGQYVYVNMVDKRKILASHSLGYYDDLLSGRSFYRVHKSFIVNAKRVARIITTPTPKVELTNNSTIDLAIRRKESFIAFLKSLNSTR